MSKHSRNNDDGFKRTITILFVFIIICATILIIKIKMTEHIENEMQREVSQVLNTIELSQEDTNTIDNSPTISERVLKVKELQKENSDIIGWIEIEDTEINYPILKDNDNLYYLKHNYLKKYNSNGSIFTLDINPFEDSETLLYGHNMKNGTMFSVLGKYLDKDFLLSHQNIKIYTPNKNYEGVIFSVYSIGIGTEKNNISNLSFDEKIEYYKKASRIKIDNVEVTNKIVKLSTCSYINSRTRPTDQRYYIIATLKEIN